MGAKLSGDAKRDKGPIPAGVLLTCIRFRLILVFREGREAPAQQLSSSRTRSEKRRAVPPCDSPSFGCPDDSGGPLPYPREPTQSPRQRGNQRPHGVNENVGNAPFTGLLPGCAVDFRGGAVELSGSFEWLARRLFWGGKALFLFLGFGTFARSTLAAAEFLHFLLLLRREHRADFR